MSDFKSQIARHRDAVNELHARIHQTYKEMGRSKAKIRAWRDACDDFHDFRSNVDALLEAVSVATLSEDKYIRQFVFDFLSVDPIYFRSGYEKERLLRFLRPLTLTEPEKAVLRETILRRIRDGALREFRRFCLLIPKIQTSDFVAELETAAKSTDPRIQRRAAYALKYVNDRSG